MKTILTAISLCIFNYQLQAQVSFTLSSTPGVGTGPYGVTTGDVNGDGKLDLICANSGGNTLSLFTNDGSGGFVLASSPVVGNGPVSVYVADVNGDGKVDLISANNSDSTLSVLTNNGSGGFVLASLLNVNGGAYSAIACDVNGDGKLDLVCANYGNGNGSTISVLTNNGTGGFVLAASPSVGNGPVAVVAADVNGDGKLDLISANVWSSTLSVLTNNGTGGYALAATLSVGAHPYSVTAADMNGDGKVDLISANRDANTLTVLTNNGGGGFVLSTTLSVGSNPGAVTAADVNGDGWPDLISANNSDNTLSVLTNNGSGGFALAAAFGVGNYPNMVKAADVNGDGKLDLISANYGGNSLSVLTNGTLFPPASPPILTAQPISQTNFVGSTANFSVGATAMGGALLFNYQWRLAGTNLPAATNNALFLPNLSLTQAGSYDVVITNFAGSITSNPALLDLRYLIEVNGQYAAGTIDAIAFAVVTIPNGYPNGFVFYTLDGSTPTTNSTVYNGPINLTNSAVVQAMSLSADFTQTAFASLVSVQILPAYNLQTSVIGNGTLIANPASGPYFSNSVVTLTANAALHWAFDHWTGDATGSQNPLSVTMNGPRSLQAVFVQTAYPLTLTTPGGGGMTANGQVVAPATYYPTGSVVTVAVTASNGWSFLGWQGSATGINNPLSVTMNQTNNLQAIFGTVAATNSSGGGIILSQPNPIPYGTKLTVSAVPDSGNYFVTWGGSVTGTNAPTKITVTNANPNISALFTPLPVGKYTLSVVVNGNGFVTNYPPRNYYNPGDTVTLKATTNAGTYFFGWAQDASGTNNPFTVLMTTNKIIQASFGVAPTVGILPLNLTVLAGSNALLSANAAGLPPLVYQWQNNNGDIAGATNAILTLSNIQPTNAGNYFVVVTNSFGSVTSALATVMMIGFPTITNQPSLLTTVTSGHTASFVVGAYGWPALTYQWQFNGTNLVGATNTALTLQNAFPANAGVYTITITNVYGSVTSNPAMLTVLPLNIMTPTKLANGRFQFSFDTAAGIYYAVEYSTNLTEWYPLVTVGGNGAQLTLIDPNTAGSQQRFYRVILQSPQ
jgi:hypothetical protein